MSEQIVQHKSNNNSPQVQQQKTQELDEMLKDVDQELSQKKNNSISNQFDQNETPTPQPQSQMLGLERQTTLKDQNRQTLESDKMVAIQEQPDFQHQHTAPDPIPQKDNIQRENSFQDNEPILIEQSLKSQDNTLGIMTNIVGETIEELKGSDELMSQDIDKVNEQPIETNILMDDLEVQKQFQLKEEQEKKKIEQTRLNQQVKHLEEKMKHVPWAFKLKARQYQLDQVQFKEIVVPQFEFHEKDIPDEIGISVSAEINSKSQTNLLRLKVSVATNGIQSVLGRTEVQKNTRTPTFKKNFKLNFDFCTQQQLIFELLNLDSNYNDNDAELIGQATLPIKDILFCKRFPLASPLTLNDKETGQIFIRQLQTTNGQYMLLQIAADSCVELMDNDKQERVYLKVHGKQKMKGVTTTIQTILPKEEDLNVQKLTFEELKYKQFMEQLPHTFLPKIQHELKKGLRYQSQLSHVGQKNQFCVVQTSKYGKTEIYIKILCIYSKDQNERHFITLQCENDKENIAPYIYILKVVDNQKISEIYIMEKADQIIQNIYIVQRQLYFLNYSLEKYVMTIQSKARTPIILRKEQFDFYLFKEQDNEAELTEIISIQGEVALYTQLSQYYITVYISSHNQQITKKIGKLSKSQKLAITQNFLLLVLPSLDWDETQGFTFSFEPQLIFDIGQAEFNEFSSKQLMEKQNNQIMDIEQDNSKRAIKSEDQQVNQVLQQFQGEQKNKKARVHFTGS